MQINTLNCQKELNENHLVLKKFYGQVFTTDQDTIEKFVETVEKTNASKMKVIEIGAGLGYLTLNLIQKTPELTAIEFDEELFKALFLKIKSKENFNYLEEKSDLLNKFFIHKETGHKLHLMQGDILEFTPSEEPYLLVGNIPFHLSGKIYRKFLSEATHKPEGVIFITDKNYAQTLMGQPPRCYRVSLQAQAYGDIEIIADVPPESVYPPPKVTCCIMKIIQNDIEPPENFWEVVNYHWEHFPTPEVESPKAMGLKRWLNLCKKRG